MALRNRISCLTRLIACLSLLLLVLPVAHAIKNDVNEPIHINARTVEANEKTGVAVYRGNVLIEQGPLSIKADRVEVRTRKNITELISATGEPAKLIRQPDAGEEEMEAEADRIDYRVSDGKLDMIARQGARRPGRSLGPRRWSEAAIRPPRCGQADGFPGHRLPKGQSVRCAGLWAGGARCGHNHSGTLGRMGSGFSCRYLPYRG